MKASSRAPQNSLHHFFLVSGIDSLLGCETVAYLFKQSVRLCVVEAAPHVIPALKTYHCFGTKVEVHVPYLDYSCSFLCPVIIFTVEAAVDIA